MMAEKPGAGCSSILQVTTQYQRIDLLQAGIDKSSSGELKKHAKMMKADHEKLDATVKNYLSAIPIFPHHQWIRQIP